MNVEIPKGDYDAPAPCWIPSGGTTITNRLNRSSSVRAAGLPELDYITFMLMAL